MNKFLKIVLSLYFLVIAFFLLIGHIPNQAFSLVNAVTPLVPYVIVTQFLVLVVLILLKQRKALILLVVFILLSIPIFRKTYSFGSSSSADEKTLTILSYNTSFFSVPQVYKKDYFDNNYPHKAPLIREWVLAQKPDVICFQEFFNDEKYPLYNTIDFFERNGYQTYNFYKAKHDNGLQRGIVTFSRFPIIQSGVVDASPSSKYNAIIYTDLLIEEDTMRVFNVHLKSMKLGGIHVKNYLRRQKSTAIERSLQAQKLRSVIDTTTHPVVVAGDFNETPYSNTMKQLYAVLENGHEEKEIGFGFTYQIYKSLGVRIDHIFASKEVDFQSFTTFSDVDLSEHKPIQAGVLLLSK